jgi:hypothetical protein
MPASVSDLERRFDAELLLAARSASSAALRGAAARWSQAIWAEAVAAGPLTPAADEIERGFELAQRPIFVAGVHRSGTTLLRDLLDGHPALAVLPSEGTFMTNLAPHLRRMPLAQHLPHAGQEWLRRLANPINQPPYWTLGRSAELRSPYVDFARALIAWWPLARQRFELTVTSWPLVAIALAYAQCTTGLSAASPLQRWAEKTPTNERFLKQLLAEFPHARFLHVIRHPFAVYASRKAAEQRAGRWVRSARRVLSELMLSYRIAVEQQERMNDRYLLVRYEDLTDDTERCMERIAAFLGIEPAPILLRPTVAGMAATNNSSFANELASGGAVSRSFDRPERLTPFERDCLVALVADSAVKLGYALEAKQAWRAWALRLARRVAI